MIQAVGWVLWILCRNLNLGGGTHNNINLQPLQSSFLFLNWKKPGPARHAIAFGLLRRLPSLVLHHPVLSTVHLKVSSLSSPR